MTKSASLPPVPESKALGLHTHTHESLRNMQSNTLLMCWIRDTRCELMPSLSCFSVLSSDWIPVCFCRLLPVDVLHRGMLNHCSTDVHSQNLCRLMPFSLRCRLMRSPTISHVAAAALQSPAVKCCDHTVENFCSHQPCGIPMINAIAHSSQRNSKPQPLSQAG